MKSPYETDYNDSFIDRLFIRLFSHKMATALGKNTNLEGYAGFVDLSRQIMQGRTAAQQQEVVARVLKSLVPSQVLWLIRHLFSPTRLVCELNAWFAVQLFEWLVGPCEVTEAEFTDEHGNRVRQQSRVHIKKCRYLEQSNCVGMCINMCKLPTQNFFTQDFGIPLTMTPNFEDYSCEMVFGQMAPPLETEAAYTQPCLLTKCETASPYSQACPKIQS